MPYPAFNRVDSVKSMYDNVWIPYENLEKENLKTTYQVKVVHKITEIEWKELFRL